MRHLILCSVVVVTAVTSAFGQTGAPKVKGLADENPVAVFAATPSRPAAEPPCTAAQEVATEWIRWDPGILELRLIRPTGVAADAPVEVLRHTWPAWCSTSRVVELATTTTSSTVLFNIAPEKTTSFGARLAGAMCAPDQGFATDFITAIPAKPTLTAVASGNAVIIGSSFRDPKVGWLRVERTNPAGSIDHIGVLRPCDAEYSPVTDYGPGGSASTGGKLAPGTYLYRVRTFNYGSAAGRAGVFSDPVAVTIAPSTNVPAVVVSDRPEGLIQPTGVGGSTTTFAVTNAGNVGTTVSLSQSGSFFTLSTASFALPPKASQVVTVTGLPQSEGSYSGSVLLNGEGVPPLLAIPISLLSKNPPAGSVAPTPASNRVDVAASAAENPTGSVSFTNRGSATLTGIVVSDVEWIIPQAGTITIPPGGTVSVTFTIDRSKRPDASGLIGSVDGSLSLVYLRGTSGKNVPDPHDSPSSATSRVTIVDTVKPEVVDAAVPPLGAGEVAMFIPGVGRLQGLGGRLFLSDVTFLNKKATGALGSLKLYYTSNGSSSASAKSTSLVQLLPAQPVGMYDIVKSVFNKDGEVGSLQIRTPQINDVAVNANIFNVSNPAGTYGTTIPVFRSDRSVGSGQKLFLTGLHKSATSYTNLFIQETAGLPVTVQTEFYSASGSPVGGTRSDPVAPFSVLVLGKIVPDGAVSAILTPGTGGRIQAYATPVDEASGDFWAVADWTSIYGYAKNSVVTIPVAGSVRGANNTFFRTDLAIMNSGTATASGRLSFHSRTGERFDKDISLSPKQSQIIGNVMGTLFNITVDSVGFLSFTPASSTGNFVVTSRTYTTVEGLAATYGTGVPTTSTQNALRLGQVRRLGGIEDASRATITAARPATFRTNIGLMETSGSPLTVRVTIRYSYPTSLVVAKGEAFKDYALTGRQFLLLNNIAREIIGESRETRFGDLRNMEIDFEVISGAGSLALFTSSIDNGTGDSLLRVD